MKKRYDVMREANQKRMEKIKQELAVSIMVPVCILLWLITVGANWPGHYSVDSIVQLAEGVTGYYASFNPPLMSQVLAAMSEMGGHGVFMTVNAALFFLALALILIKQCTGSWHSYLALFFAALASLNPITLIYNGIVWKDVFCANLLLLAFAIIFFSPHSRWVSSLFALFLAALATLVRQQGALVALIICAYAAYELQQPQRIFQRNYLIKLSHYVAIWIGLTAIVHVLVLSQQKETITSSTSTGFAVAAYFDVAGMVVNSKAPESILGRYIKDPQAAIRAAHQAYTPDRIDSLGPFNAAMTWTSGTRIFSLWWELARAEPKALLHHKLAAAGSLFGSRPNGECLPAHVGVAIETMDILRNGPRISYFFPDGFLPQPAGNLSKIWEYRQWGLLLYSGWLWLGLLFIVLVIGYWRRNFLAVGLAVSGGLYAFSFAVIGIACDFRYQYFSVVASMLGFVSLLASSSISRQVDNVNNGRS